MENTENIYDDKFYIFGNNSHAMFGEFKIGSRIIPPAIPKTDNINRELLKFQSRKMFVKMYKTTIRELGKVLSQRELSWLLLMSTYQWKDDDILYSDNGATLTKKELADELGVDPSNFNKTMKRYEDLGVAKVVNIMTRNNKIEKAIVINPYIFYNGEYAVREVVEMFDNTVWATYSKN